MPTVTVNRDCICCGECGDACPQGIMKPIRPDEGNAYAQYACAAPGECLGCGLCAEACDQGAITVEG